MGEFVTLTAADGHQFQAWVDGPADAKSGLVVIQEIFGVNSHMRNVCARFAAAGYRVVSPALFDRAEAGVELGYDAEGVARGLDLRSKISEAQVMQDVSAAADALGERVKGIVGYCWGGTLAWWGATRTTQFAAANGWYGGGIAAARAEAPHVPVQLHFGEKDTGIPLSDVELIRQAQPDVEIFVYDDAPHGFGCDDRAAYREAPAELAWTRTLAFFATHLKA
ncbi:MAG: dienelactone hydrolase family protein [Acetobacteraceae bacterium]|nr:dienelactone hydrolase family protein [Acetobacteraceae bacterium]